MSECPFANIMAPTYLGDGFEGADVAKIRAAGPAVQIARSLDRCPLWAHSIRLLFRNAVTIDAYARSVARIFFAMRRDILNRSG